MPSIAHAFRGLRAQVGAGSAPRLRAMAPGRVWGCLELAVLVALEKELQGWDKAQFGECSGLERQGRERDKASAAARGSAFP